MNSTAFSSTLRIRPPQQASQEFTHLLCLFDSDTMLGEAGYGDGAPDQCDSFLSALEMFCAAHPRKVVVANTFCFRAARWLNFADLLHPQSLRSTEYRLNERLISIAHTCPNLLLLDIELIFRQHGEDALLSAPFWYLGGSVTPIGCSGRWLKLCIS